MNWFHRQKHEVCVKLAVCVCWRWSGESDPVFVVNVFGRPGERKMPTPTGSVSIIDTTSGNTVATGSLDANGNASISWASVTGTYSFIAKYSGDSNFESGQSPTVPYVVTAVLQQVTVTLSASPASPQPSGTSVTFVSSVVGA